MPLSIYQASVPVMVRGLTVLVSLLDKGASHAAQSGQAETFLVEARLAPDMLTLAGQVQRASDTAKFAAARLTNEAAPSFSDEEVNFEQLRQRCFATIEFLKSVKPDAFEGAEGREITFGGRDKTTLSGDRYLLNFALPNFFFHLTTAYDILRHAGVAIGKRDYLGTYA